MKCHPSIPLMFEESNFLDKKWFVYFRDWIRFQNFNKFQITYFYFSIIFCKSNFDKIVYKCHWRIILPNWSRFSRRTMLLTDNPRRLAEWKGSERKRTFQKRVTGNGCYSVGRAVASNTIQSSASFYVENLFTMNCSILKRRK